MNILHKTLLAAAFFLMAATIFVQSLIQYRGNQVSGIPEPLKASAPLAPKTLKLNDLVTVHGKLMVKFSGEGEDSTNEQMSCNMTARIVDIRPDGSFVLESRKTMHVDDYVIENTLSGVARPEDILPNNTILSERLAELSISRRSTGAIDRRSVFDHCVSWHLIIAQKLLPIF